MGKVGEEQSLPTTVDAQNTVQNAENRCRVVGRLFNFRCVFALLLGVSVLLSAVFWLPPLFHQGDQVDLDLDSQFRDHDIVASFMVKKPVSLLENNFSRLEDDIFGEIGVPSTKVEIISAEMLGESNITKVVFGIVHDENNSRISSAAKSLIRASFVSLVIHQSSLRLTASLFGDPFSFEVLKFIGGITVNPPQSAFPLQKVQILFNFTLNSSIEQIQENFNELTSQLKSGLHLALYENLYISLTNSRGSTVAPPTTVQSSVLLAVGNTPSMARLKQLAQTITGSHTKNLGLNNTEFGRVKQVHLSSILQHSLNGGNNGGGASSSPSPAPLPHTLNYHHHQHHHHHHHHDAPHLPPAIPPAPARKRGSSKHSSALPPVPVPAPAPQEGKPPDCHFGYPKRFFRKANKHTHLVPPVAPPLLSPTYTAPSPQLQIYPPAPVAQLTPVSSPLPNVVFAHTHPSSENNFGAELPDITPSLSPLQSSSCAGGVPTHLWGLLMFLLVALHL